MFMKVAHFATGLHQPEGAIIIATSARKGKHGPSLRLKEGAC
jgi:hypothetical protein